MTGCACAPELLHRVVSKANHGWFCFSFVWSGSGCCVLRSFPALLLCCAKTSYTRPQHRSHHTRDRIVSPLDLASTTLCHVHIRAHEYSIHRSVLPLYTKRAPNHPLQRNEGRSGETGTNLLACVIFFVKLEAPAAQPNGPPSVFGMAWHDMA